MAVPNVGELTVEIRPGAKWDRETRDVVRALVVESGGVPDKPALVTNLREALRIVVVHVDGKIAAVGASKKPQDSYVKTTSAKSGIDISKIRAELGYIAVLEKYRHKGIGKIICDKLLDGFSEPLFATTGDDDMKAILNGRGFTKQGKSWPGRKGGPFETLMLFIRT